jgi:hypothetical protein
LLLVLKTLAMQICKADVKAESSFVARPAGGAGKGERPCAKYLITLISITSGVFYSIRFT